MSGLEVVDDSAGQWIVKQQILYFSIQLMPISMSLSITFVMPDVQPK